MAGFVGKLVFNRILGEKLSNKHGTEDPYFEYVPAKDIDKKPNPKLKRQKKPLPAGISANDAKVLTKVKRRAYRLDNSINICGIKFGVSSVFGLIPAIGDVIDLAFAFMVLNTCRKVDGGLPSNVQSKMLINIFLDFVVGLVPFLGDVADALFRCNTKNAILLEKHLYEKGQRMVRGNAGHESENGAGRSRYDHEVDGLDMGNHPRRPERVKTAENTRGGSWFRDEQHSREPDLERGDDSEYEYRPAQPPRHNDSMRNTRDRLR